METSYLNTNMWKFQSSKIDDSGAHFIGSSKAYSKVTAFKIENTAYVLSLIFRYVKGFHKNKNISTSELCLRSIVL